MPRIDTRDDNGRVGRSAGEVTYRPAALDDWEGGADPGQAGDALDVLASRGRGVWVVPFLADGSAVAI
jgi:hypothetical protein